jgi:hypothetical protein
VLILAVAILGAAWMLKPVPVEQVSQKELEHREEVSRFVNERVMEQGAKRCTAALGKTLDTFVFDQLDPKQKDEYRKCLYPEDTRSWMRRTWNKLCGIG